MKTILIIYWNSTGNKYIDAERYQCFSKQEVYDIANTFNKHIKRKYRIYELPEGFIMEKWIEWAIKKSTYKDKTILQQIFDIPQP